MNTTDGTQYGLLVPHHNGNTLFGKTVRVDLKFMDNASCADMYRMESLDINGNTVVAGMR